MKILVTEPSGLPAKALQALQSVGEAVLFSGTLPLSAEDLAGVDGVMIRLGMHWDGALMARCPDLKFIATATTGVTHIDVAAARKCGIDVMSLKGIPGLERITSTPEHALGLLLALARNIVPACESARDGRWDRYAFTGTMLSHKHVGIVGLGRTGRAFARMVCAMDMVVHYYDPYVDEPEYNRTPSIEALAAQCDVISVHAESTDETAGLLDTAFFRACKPGVLLVNTSRGELVDESALVEALNQGRLAGAALDVVCAEPVTGQSWESPLRDYCRAHSNLIITPHIAGVTSESIPRAEEILAESIARRFA